jgi:hypothetical protein
VTVARASGRGSGRAEVEATGEGLRGRLGIRALGSVEGFSGAFSKHGKLAKFLKKIWKRGWGLTFDDDDVFFRSIVIVFLVVVEPSALCRAAVSELFPSSGYPIPVAALASVVARAAAFEV